MAKSNKSSWFFIASSKPSNVSKHDLLRTWTNSNQFNGLLSSLCLLGYYLVSENKVTAIFRKWPKAKMNTQNEMNCLCVRAHAANRPTKCNVEMFETKKPVESPKIYAINVRTRPNKMKNFDDGTNSGLNSNEKITRRVNYSILITTTSAHRNNKNRQRNERQ